MDGFVCETQDRQACYVRVGTLFLAVQQAALTDLQTRALMDGIVAEVQRNGPGTALLMFAPTASPTVEQRRIIIEEYGERTGIKSFRRVALLSSSMVARGVLTALGWLSSGSRMRALKPSEWRRALAWLAEDATFDLELAEARFRALLTHCGCDDPAPHPR